MAAPSIFNLPSSSTLGKRVKPNEQVKEALVNAKTPLEVDEVLSSTEMASSENQAVTSTAQATITFTAAPAVISVVWKVLIRAIPSLGEAIWLPIILSLTVGILIYIQGIPPGTKLKNQFTPIFFATLNSFSIAAAVLGIDTATSD